MKKCPHCNTNNKDQAKFCRNCGKPLQKKNSKKSKGSNHNRTIAAVIVILIIIVAGGAFAVNYMNHQSPVEKTNPIAVDNTTDIPMEKSLDNQTTTPNETDNLTTAINQTNVSNETNNQTTPINQTNDSTETAKIEENNKEDVKILGMTFEIPEGYSEESFNSSTIEGDDSSTTINGAGKLYENDQGDTICIVVIEIANGDSLDEDQLKQYGEETGYDITEMTINGKDGYYYVDDLEEPVWYDFIYLKRGKIIDIAVSDKNMLDEAVQ